jgi:hypothetical protein
MSVIQLTDVGSQRVINHLLGISDTFGTGAWLALYTTAPGFTGGGVEATGYSRGLLTTWTLATSSGFTTATLDAAEGIASAPAATIVAWAVHDQAVGGSALFFCVLDTPVTLSAGDNYLFTPGDLFVSSDF